MAGRGPDSAHGRIERQSGNKDVYVKSWPHIQLPGHWAQYQKEIRLLEARRLLMSEGESVTLAALKVGYESPNQFSREYVRKFGLAPSSALLHSLHSVWPQ